MMIRKKYLTAFILLFTVELYIGLFIRDDFIRPFIGDILVVILLYFLIRIFLTPKTKLLPAYIFLFAVMVELGQLINVLHIIGFENNHFARIIFGATFDIKDILCYFVGCLLLLLWQELEYVYLKK